MPDLYAKARRTEEEAPPPQVLHLRGPGLPPAGQDLRLEALHQLERGRP